MGDRASKNALFDALSKVAKALGSGRRAELIDVLAQGERGVDGLAHQIDQSVANTSHHLQVLARAGLVATRRDGTHIYYRLASDRVGDLWGALRDVASQHVAEVSPLAEAYLGDVRGMEEMSRQALVERLGDDDLVLIDVRPKEEFRAGHIPNARFVGLDELDGLSDGLTPGSTVIAYCRGPHCSFAVDAVRRLREAGHDARKLEEGFPEWKRAGLPVAVAEPG